MLTVIVAVLFIAVGAIWSFATWFAAGMASRPVDTWNEVVKPAAWGLAPIALGVSLLIWG
jgi:hypothetical protein